MSPVSINVSSGTVNVSAGALLGLSSGTWAGLGEFVKDGPGILSIAASGNAPTRSGGFRLAAGELQLSGNGDSVFGTGTFIITGGTIRNMGGNSPTFAAPQRWEGPFTFANSTTWGATSGTVALANNPTVTVAAAATATIQGTITGTSGFTKSGNGVLSLTNTNSFTGLTAVNSGTLSLGNNRALQNSPIDTNSMSSGGRINNASALAPTIGGLTGGTDLAATSGTLFTNWASTTALTLNPQAGTSYTYSGVIANGAANMTLTKTGAGTQVLTGSSTFAGATTIAEGTLSVDRILNSGVNSPLGTNSTVNVGGTSSTPGILRYTGSGETTNRVFNLVFGGTGVIESSGAGPLVITSTATNTGGGRLVLMGTNTGTNQIARINGSGVSVDKDGPGTWWFTGTSSFNGDFRVLDGSAIVSRNVADAAASPVGSGNITVGGTAASGEARFLLSNAQVDRVITVASGTGQRVLIGAAPNATSATFTLGTSLILNRDVTLVAPQSGTATFEGEWFTNDFEPATQNVRIGHGDFLGTVALSGMHTTTGTVSVEFGRLEVTESGGLGAGLVRIDGSELNFNGLYNPLTSPLAFTGNNGLLSGAGIVEVTSVDATGTGNQISAVLSGASLTKTGLGTVALTGENTYTGQTTINAGVLQIGSGGTTGSIDGSGGLLLGNVGLVVNRSDAFTQSFASTTVTGNASVAANATNTLDLGTLTVQPGVFLSIGSTGTFITSSSNVNGILPSTIFGGTTWAVSGGAGNPITGLTSYTQTSVAQNTPGDYTTANVDVNSSPSPTGAITPNTLRFASTAANTLTLTGSNTLSAGILVNASVGANVSTISGGSLAGLGGGLSVVQNNPSQALVIGSSIVDGSPGTGLTKFGPGTLTLSGSNSFSGTTSIVEGQLVLANSQALGQSTFAGGSGTLSFGGLTAATFGGLVGNFNLPLANASSSPVVLSVGANGQSTTYAGVLSGGGGLTKTGTGTLTVIGANTYTGTTTVNAGALQIGNGGAVGSIASTPAITGASDGTIIFNRSDNYGGSVATPISGGLSLTQAGSGTLTLTGNNTFTGPTRVAAGQLTVGGSLALQNSTLDLATGDAGTASFSQSSTVGGLQGSRNLSLGSTTLSVGNNSSSTTYSGVISGPGSLTKIGSGQLTLSGNNTFTGLTTVSTGTLAIGEGGTSGSIAGNVSTAANATIAFNRSDAVSYSGTISGGGGLVKQGASQLTLTGNNTFTGLTTVSAGTLAVGSGGASGSIAGNVSTAANAAIAFNRSDAVSYSGTISGGGGLVKEGAGTLTLSGTNSYSGGTRLSGGTVVATNNSSLGAGSVTLAGSALQLKEVTLAVPILLDAANSELVVDRPDLNVEYLVVGGGGGGGAFRGGGGGAGGFLTNVGGTALAVNGATSVVVGAGGAGGSYTSLTIYTSGSQGGSSSFGNVVAAGGGGGAPGLASNSSFLNIPGGVAGGAGGSGGGGSGGSPFGAGGAGNTPATTPSQGNAGAAGSSGGNWSGSGGGAGGAATTGATATAAAAGIGRSSFISGSNVFYAGGGGSGFYTAATSGGPFTIAGGTGGGGAGGGSGEGSYANRAATAGSANTGGGGGGGANPNAGASFTVGAAGGSGIVIVRYLGSQQANGGTVTAGSGSSAGYTIHTFTAGSDTFTPLASGLSTISGNISGTGGILKSGSGTLTLTGANTYAGTTTINAGMLQIGSGSTTGSIASTSSITGSSGGTIVFNRSDNYGGNFATQITGGIGLTQAGSGTLTLSGSNTFSGTTTVSAGQLLLSNTFGLGQSTFAGGSGTLSFGGLTAATFGGLAGNSNLGLSNASSSPVVLSVGANGESTSYAGILSGAGSLTKTGTGTLTLTGNNTFTGPTRVAAGQLTVGGSLALQNSTLDLATGDAGTASFSQSSTVGGLQGSRNLSLGSTTLSVGNNSSSTTYSGVISGPGSLTKIGSGQLTLSGNNTFTGLTTVSTGTLAIGEGGTSGSIAGNVSTAANATIAFNRSDAVSYSGTISGGGGLVKQGASQLTLTGNNTFTGLTTVSAGTLAIGSGGASGSIAGNVSTAANATVAFNRSDALTYGGTISGGGGLVKQGAGTLTLSGSQTYTGPTAVSAGTLVVPAAGASLPSQSVVSIDSSATLSLQQANNSNSLVLNGGTLLNSTRGSLLNGASFTGGVSSTVGDNLVYTFTTTGTSTLSLPVNTDARALLVGGGGGGGGAVGGGGGGGGVVSLSRVPLVSGSTYQIVVGNGGAGGTGVYNLSPAPGKNGQNSSAFGAVAAGGGGGGSLANTQKNGLSGGSGGGGAASNSTSDLPTGGSATGSSLGAGNSGTVYGNSGGSVTSGRATNISGDEPTSARGGGGAGAAATSGLAASTAGSGGVGIQDNILGPNYYWGGGGGGAAYKSFAGGNGGLGGGGGGASFNTTGGGLGGSEGLNSGSNANPIFGNGAVGGAGGANTGGGGGGGTWNNILSGGTGGSGGSGIVVVSYAAIYARSTLTLTGPIRVDATSTLDDSGNFIQLDSAMSGLGGITKSGTGTLTLSGSNTFSGPTTVSAGQLLLSNTFALGQSTFAGGPGTLSFGSLTAATFGGLSGNSNLALSNTSSAAVALTVGANGESTSYAGILSGGAGSSLTKTGSGTLTLTGANTYAGTTTINAGMLQIGSGSTTGSIASTSSITGSSGGTIVFNRSDNYGGNFATQITGGIGLTQAGSGTLTLSAANTYSGPTTVSAGVLRLGVNDALFNTTALAVSGGGFDLAGFNDTVASVALTSGSIFGGGTLTAASYGLSGGRVSANLGAGTLTVTGNSNLDGTSAASVVNLNAGTLTLGTAGRLSSSAAVTGSSGGALALGGNETIGSLAGGANIALGSNTLSLGGLGTSTSYAGTMSGSGSLTKQGAGQLTLTGNNTFTGLTTVEQGAIAVNGGLAGGLSVLAGATLMGSGTIGGDATIAGIHAPGNSPGIETFASNLTYLTGASVIWDLQANTADAGLRGIAYDGINVGGNLTFSGSTTLNLNFGGFGSGSVNWEDSFWNESREWLLYSVSGTTTNFGNFVLTSAPASWIDSTGTSFASSSRSTDGSFSVVQQGSNVLLQYVIVPEPAAVTLALIGIAAAAYAVRRRRS